MEIKTELIGRRRKAATRALVDGGATGNFINQDYAIRLNMQLKSLANKIPFAGANKNKSYVTHYTEVNMKTEDSQGKFKNETIRLYLAELGTHDIILGTPWLVKNNPHINWKTYHIKFRELGPEEDIQQNTEMQKWKELYARHVIPVKGNFAQKLATQATKGRQEKPTEDILPKEYHQYLDVFSEELSEKLPPR